MFGSEPETVEEIDKSCEGVEDIYILESIIKEGTVNILSGDESSGKTTLMLNLCKAISDEEKFLGLKTTKKKILYITTEMSKKEIKKILDDLKLKDRKNMSILYNESESIESLTYKVMNYDVIIYDIFVQLFIAERKDPNNYSDCNEIYSKLRSASGFQGKTIILVHHNNKQGGINGSTGVASGSVTRMIFSMPNGRMSNDRKLLIYGKGIEQNQIDVNFDFKEKTMCLGNNKVESFEIDNAVAYIIEKTIKNKKIEGTCQEIYAKLGLSRFSINPNAITKLLNKNESLLAENNIVYDNKRQSTKRIIVIEHKTDEVSDT